MGDEKQINQELANPISKLDEVTRISADDRFALFRARNGGADSYGLPYSRLVQQLVTDISARFSLSSMAFRDKSEYAKFDHQHNYSNAACYPVYSPENTDNPIRVMSLDITNMQETKHVDVYMPKLDPPPDPEPDIGDIRFLATNSLTAKYGDIYVTYIHILPDGSMQTESCCRFNVNLQITESIENGTFDGWVFPDGSRYFKAQGSYNFSRAYRAFGGSNNEFSVPNLSGFIKANPGTYWSGDALKRMPGQIGIKPHTHSLVDYDADIGDITVSAKVKMATAMYASSFTNNNTLHVGNGGEDPIGITALTANPVDLTLNFSSSDNKKFTYDPDPADESYPKHYIMPVQVYIGKDYIGNSALPITYSVQVTNIYGNTTNYENITRLSRRSIGVTAETDSMIKKVVVGNDVTEIDAGVFANFTELTEVDLRSCSTAVEVPERCCEGCSKLTSFTFPMN